MTESRVFALICAGAALMTTIGVLGMLALGVRGVGISLGAIVPAVIASQAVGRMVVHFGAKERRSPASQG